MKNPETFCNSVLNAIHANPYTIKSYPILKAATMLRGHYLNVAKSRLDLAMGTRNYKMCHASVIVPHEYEIYVEAKNIYDDFFDALSVFVKDNYLKIEKLYRNDRKQHKKMREFFGRKYDLMNRIIESHFDEKNGIFQFNKISFG